MMFTIKKSLLLLCLGLVACQHNVRIDHAVPVGPWQQNAKYFVDQRMQFKARTEKKMSAKVAIKTSRLNEQANMLWETNQEQHTMRLFGPLGVGTVKVAFDQNGAQLQDAKGRLYQQDNAQQLLADVIGWPVPVDALAYWVFALPQPEFPYHYQLNQAGQVSALRQLGWHIEYQQYQQYNEQLMPRKIIARKHIKDELVVVRLIVKSWRW